MKIDLSQSHITGTWYILKGMILKVVINMNPMKNVGFYYAMLTLVHKWVGLKRRVRTEVIYFNFFIPAPSLVIEDV